MLLKSIFGFDQWHVIPLAERPYAIDIIRYLNEAGGVRKGSVAEIGCGLGDIIRHLRFARRLALDNDAKVLRALDFLKAATFNPGIRTRVFNFPSDSLEGKYDAILMVNWIHHIPPEVLKRFVGEYFHEHLNVGGAILVDTVQAANYKHHHSIEALTDGLACDVRKIGSYEPQREVFAIVRKG
jgi:SAM-dependent methyltransferase